MAYDAFISYSHAADGRLAPAVQLGLQRLARPWYRARSLRVFRDDTGLAVNPHLWVSIQQALDESEYFVLLASPEAAASPWVNREIEHWTAHKPPDRLLPVLTDGTLFWDAARGNYNLDLSDALPPALAGGFPAEPRHLDLRWARDETELDLRHARFRDAIADLAAPMHHLPKDELESEDVRQHRRTVRLARGATTVLALLLVVTIALGVVAWQQRAVARHETSTARQAATAALARGLASESLNVVHDGRNDLGLLLAVQANRVQPTVNSRTSLLTALINQPALDLHLHGLSAETVSALVFSPDSRFLAGATVGGQLLVWDLRSGQLLPHQPSVSGAQFLYTQLNLGSDQLRFADDGRVLVAGVMSADYVHPGGVVAWDVATGQVIQRLAIGGEWAVGAHTALVATDDSSGTIRLRDLRSAQDLGSISSGRPEGRLAMSSDGASVAVVSSDIRAWNVATRGALGPACTSKQAAASSVLALDMLADHQTVRLVTTDLFDGTYALIERCHADTGVVASTRVDVNDPVAAVSGDDSIVATRKGQTVQLIDTKTRTGIGDPVAAPFGGHMVYSAGTVVFAPDGRHYAATQYGGELRVWRTSPDSPLGQRLDLGAICG